MEHDILTQSYPPVEALSGRTRTVAGILRWRLHPTVLLRSAGFPFEMVAGLADPALAVATRRRRRLRDEAVDARSALLEGAEPLLWEAVESGTTTKSAVLNVLRDLRRGRPPRGQGVDLLRSCGAAGAYEEWERAHEGSVAATAAEEALHRAALELTYERVAERCDDPRVEEAVFLSNPTVHTRLYAPGATLDRVRAGETRRRAERVALRTAHRYLRRLAVKCDMTSFFGPVLFAELDAGADERLTVGTPAGEEVAVDASAWLARELARGAARGRPATAPIGRRDPLWRIDGDSLVRTLDGKRRAVAPAALAFWCALEPDRAPEEVARRAGIEPDVVPALIAELRGTIVPAPEVPATSLWALRDLVRAAPWDPAARALLEQVESFAAAPWPERRLRFLEIEATVSRLGLEPRRHAGQHYADRLVLHEERTSPWSERVRVGREPLEALRRGLDAVLPAMFLAALLEREDARVALREVLGGRERPLIEIVGADLQAPRPRRDALTACLAEVLERAPRSTDEADGGRVAVIELAGETFARAIEPLWKLVAAEPDDQLACLPGLDLLAAGPGLAPAAWILGECHDDSSTIFGGTNAALHSAAPGLWKGFLDELTALVDTARLASVVSRRRNKNVTPELPGLSIELTGRSVKPRAEVAPIAEVLVAADGRAVTHAGRRFALYPGDLSSTVHRALALPSVVPLALDTSDSTPRVVLGGLVLQRARWRVELPDPAGGDIATWRDVQDLRADLGWPRHVFVRHPAEPKPLHVDLDDPLAVLELRRLGSGTLLVTEMLPRGDSLWWSPDARARVAELRVACLMRLDPTT